MHPLIQSDLAVLRQAELLQSMESVHVLTRVLPPTQRRARWMPSRVHLALFRLRLRHRARHQRLAHRQYGMPWRSQVRRLLDE